MKTNLEKAKEKIVEYLYMEQVDNSNIIDCLELAAQPDFRNAALELPKGGQRCYVMLDDGQQTIAEYWDRDALEFTCRDDEEGWFESTIEFGENKRLERTVLCWMPVFESIKYPSKQA